MVVIVAINEPDHRHLAQVIAEMRELGAPTLRAIRDEAQGVILALEGSHRLAAALELGLTPRLELVNDDTPLRCDDIGWDDMGWFEGRAARAGDIRDRIARPMGTYDGCPMYDFDQIEFAAR